MSVTEQALARFPQPSEPERARRLDEAINGLGRLHPGYVSTTTFVRWQVLTLAAVGASLAVGFALVPRLTAAVLTSVVVLFYLITMVARAIVFSRGLVASEGADTTEPLRVADADLPFYTVLMPAYDEPEVIEALMRTSSELDYPADRLEILLLIEEDDERTLSVLMTQPLPAVVRVILVPAGEPRTKPKACNYGMAFARGDLVTIYDAEDRPEPLQLRRAAEAFAHADADVACFQARLHYFNPTQNLLTRWFTIEYTTWFGVFLRGLDVLGLPIPLGGTSNHVRADALRQAGSWDAFNVTEDAELGLRLARLGYRTAVLDSVTLEEANSDLVNWVRQRSRWYKGYLQTWLAHFRRPGQSVEAFGWKGAASITLLIGATPVLAVANLFTWLCTAVFIIGVPASVASVFPTAVIYLGTTCALVGNASVIYVSILAMAQHEDGRFAWASLLYPLYWLLMAVAATKACIQLALRPSYWEKTVHGLTGGAP